MILILHLILERTTFIKLTSLQASTKLKFYQSTQYHVFKIHLHKNSYIFFFLITCDEVRSSMSRGNKKINDRKAKFIYHKFYLPFPSIKHLTNSCLKNHVIKSDQSLITLTTDNPLRLKHSVHQLVVLLLKQNCSRA